MRDIFKWLMDGRALVGALIGAIAGTLVTLATQEFLRVALKSRLLVTPAMMPSFRLKIGDGKVTLTVHGEYGVVNMSDLPISINRPILIGYNAASRAFQFNAGGICPVQDLLKEVTVTPSSEVRLISQGSWAVGIDRYCVRWGPMFIWLETIDRVRIGRKRKSRWRAHLYITNWYSRHGNEASYSNTGVETSATKARLLALPGKLLTRHRWAQRPS